MFSFVEDAARGTRQYVREQQGGGEGKGARDAVLHEHEVDRDVYLLLRSRFAKCSGPACTAVVALLVLSRVMVHAMQHGSPTQPAPV